MNPVKLSPSTCGQQRQKISTDLPDKIPSNFKVDSSLRSTDPKDFQKTSKIIEINDKTKTQHYDLTTKKSLNELLNMLNDSIDKVMRIDSKGSLSNHFHSEEPSENQDSSSEATLGDLINLLSSSTVTNLKGFANASTKEDKNWKSKLLRHSRDDQLTIFTHPDARPTKENDQGHWKDLRNSSDREVATPEFRKNSETLSLTCSKGKGNPEFSSEVWKGKEDVPNEVFSTCPPELIEIYPESARKTNRSDNFLDFSTESFETYPEPSSIRSSRSLATQNKTPLFVNQLNFEDEIWPTNPRIFSSKDFRVCISGIVPEIVAAEKLENHSTVVRNARASATINPSSLSMKLVKSSLNDGIINQTDDTVKQSKLAEPMNNENNLDDVPSTFWEMCPRNRDRLNEFSKKSVNRGMNEEAFDEVNESRRSFSEMQYFDLTNSVTQKDEQPEKINTKYDPIEKKGICEKIDVSESTKSVGRDSLNVNEKKCRKSSPFAIDNNTEITKNVFDSIKNNNNIVQSLESNKEQCVKGNECVTNLNIVTRDFEIIRKKKFENQEVGSLQSATVSKEHDIEVCKNLKKDEENNCNDLSEETNPATRYYEISASKEFDFLNDARCSSNDNNNFTTINNNSDRKNTIEGFMINKRYNYESNSNTDSSISIFKNSSSLKLSKGQFTPQHVSSAGKTAPTTSYITSRKLNPLIETTYGSNFLPEEISYEVRTSDRQTNSQSSFASSWKSLQGDTALRQEVQHFGPDSTIKIFTEFEKRKVVGKTLKLKKVRKISKVGRAKVFARQGKGKNTKIPIFKLAENLGRSYNSTDCKKFEAKGTSSGAFVKNVYAEESKKKIDHPMTKLFEVEFVLPDVCQILTEVDEKLTINRELAKIIVQFHQPNSILLPSATPSEAAKLLAMTLTKCEDYLQSHDCSWEAINRVNELLIDAAVDLKNAVDDQMDTLKSHECFSRRLFFDCVEKDCDAKRTSTLKNAGKQVSSIIPAVLEKEKKIEKLISNMLKLTNKIVSKTPEAKKKKSPRSSNSVSYDARNTFRANDRYQTDSCLVKNPKMHFTKRDIDSIETQVGIMSNLKNVPNNINNTTTKSKNIVKPADIAARKSVKDYGKVNPRIEDRDIESRLGQRSIQTVRSAAGNSNNSVQSVKRQKNAVDYSKQPVWRPAGSVKVPPVISAVSIDQKGHQVLSVPEKRKANASTVRNDLRSSKILEGFRKSSGPSELVIGQKILIKDESETSQELLFKNNKSTNNSQDDPGTRTRFGDSKPRKRLKHGTSKEVTKIHGGKSNSTCENSKSTVKLKNSSVKSNRSDAVFSDRSKEEIASKTSETNLRKRRSRSRSRSRSRPGMPSKVSKTKILEEGLQGVEDIAPEMSEKPTKRRKRLKQSEAIRALKEIIKESSDNVINKTDTESLVSIEKLDNQNPEKISVPEPKMGVESSSLEESVDRLISQNNIDSSSTYVTLRDAKSWDKTEESKDQIRSFCTEEINLERSIVIDAMQSLGSSVQEIFKKRSISVDLQREADLSSATNVEENTIDSRTNVDANESYLKVQFSSTSVVNVGCAAELNSNGSISRISSAMYCQASSLSLTFPKTSQNQISKKDRPKLDIQTKLTLDSQESMKNEDPEEVPEKNVPLKNQEKVNINKSKKTLFNRHARSLHMLKEILSLHGLDTELVNKAERNLKLKQKRGTKNLIMTKSKDFGTDSAEECSSKLFDKLATLPEAENDPENFHPRKRNEKTSSTELSKIESTTEKWKSEISLSTKNVGTTNDLFDLQELDKVNAGTQMSKVNGTFVGYGFSSESVRCTKKYSFRSRSKESQYEEWSLSKNRDIGIGSDISIQCEVSLEETRDPDVRSQTIFELLQVCDMYTETEEASMEKGVSCPEEDPLLLEKETSVELSVWSEASAISELFQTASTQTMESSTLKQVATEYKIIPCFEAPRPRIARKTILEVRNEQKPEDRRCKNKNISVTEISTESKDLEDRIPEVRTADETKGKMQATFVSELFKHELGNDSSLSRKVNKSTGSFRNNMVAERIERPVEISLTSMNEQRSKSKIFVRQTCDFHQNFNIKALSEENLKRSSVFLFSQKNYSKTMKDVASGSCEETTKLTFANSAHMPFQNVPPDVRIFVDLLLNQADGDYFSKFPIGSQNKSTKSFERCRRPARKTKLHQKLIRPYDDVEAKRKTIKKLSLVSRKNLLSLVYAALCTFIFCCLQFTISCES